MNFEDIVLESFKTKEENLIYEEGLPITPFIAFAAFKRKAFNALKKSFKDIKDNPVSKIAKSAKAAGAEAKEKARATVGQTSGKGEEGTVYRLTKEQVEVMADIMNKYGRKIAKDVLEFRRNILAPYQLIKRQIKSSSRVSSKDKFGMTKEQFKVALESGRKKIEARGENYFDRSKDLENKIKRYNEQLSGLKEAKKSIESGESISQNVAQKVYKEFGVGDKDLSGYSPEELRKVYNEIQRNYHDIISQTKRTEVGHGNLEKGKELRQKQKELWAGKSIDLTKSDKEDFYDKGKFNVALGKYFFRREILNQLKPGQSNIFRDTYESIIDEMIKRAKEQKKDALRKLVSMKQSVDFNERESKIWKKRPTVKSFSGDVGDYYQAFGENDFLDKPIAIERSDEMKQAEQKIENAIRKFEREIQKQISPEDFNKLKKYRLINNLISVRELKNPENLFKSKDDLSKIKSKETKETKETKPYLSSDQFVRRMRELATMEFDSMSELNKAKQEAKDLMQRMKDQGDEDIAKDSEDLLRKIELRRSPQANKIKGHEYDKNLLVGIDDIEDMAKEIVNKKYQSVEQAKQDRSRLSNMIKSFKENDPNAEDDLKDIDFWIKRADIKLERGLEIE